MRNNMTKEQAIDLLDNLIGFVEDSHGSDYDQALKMAIKALEQEPCEDAISRQAVIYYVKAHIHEIITESGIDKNEHTNRVLRAIMNGVETMPSVTPKTDVLVEIRTEIEQLPTQTRTNWNGCCPDIDYPEIEYVDVTKHKLLSIIDKYKAESEESDGTL